MAVILTVLAGGGVKTADNRDVQLNKRHPTEGGFYEVRAGGGQLFGNFYNDKGVRLGRIEMTSGGVFSLEGRPRKLGGAATVPLTRLLVQKLGPEVEVKVGIWSQDGLDEIRTGSQQTYRYRTDGTWQVVREGRNQGARNKAVGATYILRLTWDDATNDVTKVRVDALSNFNITHLVAALDNLE